MFRFILKLIISPAEGQILTPEVVNKSRPKKAVGCAEILYLYKASTK